MTTIRYAARLRVRPSGVKGRSAVAARRPAAAPDPGASADPERPHDGQAQPARPQARRQINRRSAKRKSLRFEGIASFSGF
jgi:hypothetical protein